MIRPIPSTIFSWVYPSGTSHIRDIINPVGIAEMSDIPGGIIGNDGRCLFLRVESMKTNAIKDFFLKETKRDREGEIVSWMFQTDDRQFQITIYND